MANCECLAGCPFFNDKLPMDSGLGAMYKNRYCLGDNSKCARHVVFMKLGKGNVPPNLYPNQLDTAARILAS
ncbi:MAG TPA: hypothetical protein PKI32_09790 [Opitutales bacterium]|nr:hypothetical protein [Opitutales bacterium]